MPIEIPAGLADYHDDRNPPPKKRQILVFLGLFFGTITLVIWGAVALANQAITLIPPEVEQQLGRVIVPTFEQMAEPGPAQDQLNQLLDRLEREAPAEVTEGRDYQVLYVPQDVVNAIAIPGDRVIIYRGLLDQMGSENELMMVLGHELGHFAHRDHLRGLGRGIVVRVALAAVLGDVGTLGSIAIAGAENLSNAQYSQGQETQADDFGLGLLVSHYGHAAGATDFFQRLGESGGQGWDFLASHPNPDRRVRQLNAWIEERGYDRLEKRSLPSELQP
ncbi:MAG: M48 family metallopeptidase [Prochlorothrix sp.]|nr:M48 family metallopeptidase [Prochlorothrix sp.]